MSDIVIKVENVSKQYRLGTVGTGTLSHDLNRWWAKLRGKSDPYLKIGSENKISENGNTEYVWALRDISFEVKRGEVLGIIGKNGAGKSTLLKILSRVTSPTVGQLKVKGRVACLLEVGTGFHPELTGRENIFLNGSILGMTKTEIKSKFDEIVDFSGIERYIDTPVKRYSSGMYVRLAFAVAAHLEPDILIVDEVLAVGDAEFQKKCLGKMRDVSGQGRTIFFVSHNMAVIRLLCRKALYLKNGLMNDFGNIDEVVEKYLKDNLYVSDNGLVEINIPEKQSLYSTGEAKFRQCYILNSKEETVNRLEFMEPFKVVLVLKVNKNLEGVLVSNYIVNSYGERIMMTVPTPDYKPINLPKGEVCFEIDYSSVKLMPGNYYIGMSVYYFNTGSSIDFVEKFYPFEVLKESVRNNLEYPWETVHGYIRPDVKWNIKMLQEAI